ARRGGDDSRGSAGRICANGNSWSSGKAQTPEISGTALARRSVGVSSGATRSAAASFAVVILYLLLTRWLGAGRAVLPRGPKIMRGRRRDPSDGGRHPASATPICGPARRTA